MLSRLIFTLFESTKTIKLILNIHEIISGYSRICDAKIVQVKVNRIEAFSSFYVDF